MLPQVLLALVLFACAPKVYAARSMTISGNISSLLGDDILIVTASPSGFVEGETIYIKGAFFQSGTTNYFGYTKNNDAWIKNSASNSLQRSIKIGEWDGKLEAKVDYGDSGYKGENDYAFKLRFYYGAAFSADWSTNELIISISEPDPTITPLPTPSQTPTPIPTRIPSPTVSPTTISTLTPIASSTITKRIPTVTPQISGVERIDVLGVEKGEETTEVGTEASHASYEAIAPVNNLRALSIALAFVGSGFALLSAVTIWHNIKIWTVDSQSKKQ